LVQQQDLECAAGYVGALDSNFGHWFLPELNRLRDDKPSLLLYSLPLGIRRRARSNSTMTAPRGSQ
jgi:hypothetical protein